MTGDPYFRMALIIQSKLDWLFSVLDENETSSESGTYCVSARSVIAPPWMMPYQLWIDSKILAISLIRRKINTWYYSQLKINPDLVNERCLHGHYILRSINHEPINLVTTVTDGFDASTGLSNSEQFDQTRCNLPTHVEEFWLAGIGNHIAFLEYIGDFLLAGYCATINERAFHWMSHM